MHVPRRTKHVVRRTCQNVPVSTVTALVRSNRRATPTTRLLTIDPGEDRFSFRAGQWANVGLARDDIKPYSIASASKQRDLEFLIREDGSGLELSRARRGTVVYLEGPHGRFTLGDEALSTADVLFVAGGTGIAPIRSMLHDRLASAAARDRPRCSLVYSARDNREFAFLPELQRLAREGRVVVSLVATRNAPSRWKGLSGRLTAAILRSLVLNSNPFTWICGPEGFVKDVKGALEELGVERIRTEEQ
jgi:CDP-4-dehydro-6-deoxyglucose reductase